MRVASYLRIWSVVMPILWSGGAAAAPPPIPELALWEAQMIQYGQQNCNRLNDPSIAGDKKLADTYYDGERVFYLMYEYTKNSAWLTCAQRAEQVYRDGYVIGNNGGVPGYWNFPHGIWFDYKRTSDATSRNALFLLATKAAYSNSPIAWTADANGTDGGSREVAYNLMAQLLAMDSAGFTDQARINALVGQAFDHMDQWFVRKTATYVRPFMASLTSEALIMWHKKTGDARVLPIVRTAMDWIWDNMWLTADQCFKYTDRSTSTGGMEPAPDLNLLVAPVFAWLYVQTGDAKYQIRGDAIFAGGVRKGTQYLALGKQFNQNYRWSFDYVYWRSQQNSPMYALLPGSTTTTAGISSGSSSATFSPSTSTTSSGQTSTTTTSTTTTPAATVSTATTLTTDSSSPSNSRNVRHQHGPLRK